ncbi:Translation initiation factor eIF-2B epsilon subunit, partial [Candida maltosa Xu316]
MYKRQVFSPEEEIDLLNILQKKTQVLDSAYNQIILFIAIRTLYDLEVVEEDNILDWWTQGDESLEVRGLTAKFITWLKEADEEESSDDDDDEEEESE